MSSERIFDISYGGTERFTLCLANWLFTKNNNITLVGSRRFASITVKHYFQSSIQEDQYSVEMLKDSERIYLPYAISFLCSLIVIPYCILKILFTSWKYPIDLIHVQDTGQSALIAIISGKLLKIPVILTSHGTKEEILGHRLKDLISRILLKLELRLERISMTCASSVTVVNQSIKEHFEEIIKRDIDIIQIPINSASFKFSLRARNSVREEFGVKEKEIVIGYIGRFSPEKNIPTLLRSFSNIAKCNPFVKLLLVGKGPQESELKRIVTKKNICKRVIFCGVRSDISRILSCIDIFILPSFTEGMSIALLEAMASGSSIICSRIPANCELLEHDKEAIFFDPYGEKELNQAIYQLLNDTSLRTRLAENSKIKASQFDEEIIFPRILAYYDLVISKYSKNNLKKSSSIIK